MTRAAVPVGHCQVCGCKGAPFGLGWPGVARDQPAGIRGKRLKLCRLSGDCAAQAIVRAERAAGQSWPWSPVWEPLRPLVDAIRPPPDAPPRAAPAPATLQSSLF